MGKRARKALWVAASAVIVLLAGMAAVAWHMLGKVTAPPHPEPTAAHPSAPAEFTPPVGAAELGERLRLYALTVGETTVPFGQFYGGLDGWVGAAAMWKGGLGADVFWVPVRVIAIVHPHHGTILVDGGISAAQTRPLRYYSVRDGGLNAGIWRDSANRIAEDGDLIEQLAGIGVSPKDVTHIVLTHLHEDHVGELARFPDAVVHVSLSEWNDRQRTSYAPSFAMVQSWDRFDWDSGAVLPFAASKDLLGDGTIVLLPTPGHTLGHVAVLVHLGDHHTLVTGDAAYTMRHLDPDSLASFNYFGDQGLSTYRDSVRKMVELQRRLGDLIIVAPHDHFEYGRVHLPKALADGRLSPDERTRLRALQTSLYDDEGRLRREARPRFIDDQTGCNVVSDIP